MKTPTQTLTINFTPPFFLLFLVLLVLKVTGYLTWSWWWVSAPIWGPIAFVFAIVILVLLIVLALAVTEITLRVILKLVP